MSNGLVNSRVFYLVFARVLRAWPNPDRPAIFREFPPFLRRDFACNLQRIWHGAARGGLLPLPGRPHGRSTHFRAVPSVWFYIAVQHEIVLEGYGFRLEPLSQAHVGALAEIVDPEMWAGMSTPTPVGEVGMANYIEDALALSDVLPFAVIDTVNGEVVGSTALCGVNVEQERVEIGRTFYARSLWGRVVNPACKFLLMEYAFEQMGMFRISMRADSRNARSISAITRLGATFEGTLRGFRIAPDGSRCDSVSFSILFPEWVQVREGLLNRLDPLRHVSDISWPNPGKLFGQRAGDLVADGAPEE